MIHHSHVAPWLLTLLLGIGTAACGDDGDGDPGGADVGPGSDGGNASTRTLTDDGEVCLTNASSSDGGAEGLESGSIVAEVTFDACLSSTCDTVQATNCEATVRDGSITIESSATIRQTGRQCSGDCGSARAECDVGTLDEGDYTLEHGDASTMFSIPSDQEVCGAGTSPFTGAP